MTESTQIVCSKGIFQGLPVYPDSPELKGLTAIITGANGISGYHMVRVLSAAPQRWKKIYCLSRRPPPENFFTDLGEGASRVKHVSVDFLSEPEKIANALKQNVPSAGRDFVFFFSYTTTPQKGDIVSMWSDADAMAKVNSALIDNFLHGLKLANITPKRFLLQTGAKHYGFHMGPATSPSFESDPRITLENNFYYPQEDLLYKYCKENGTAWNVVRPSYIIGAVRDGALNHMLGFSIYASVQAHLKQKLEYPGDNIGWDPANEAFNMQDGLPWTCGRFWPYLAQWYGIDWSPPEKDESKYRVSESRHKTPPRGYGYPGVTRSIFSLFEWSGHPEVKQAWSELTKQHGLVLDPFKDRAHTFGVADSAVIGGWPLSLSMRKARKLGWLGTVDSYQAAFNTIHDFARLKLIPLPAVSEYRE